MNVQASVCGGLALLEALASGVKVISADVPYGPTEILNNGQFGVLFSLGDAPALSNLIIKCLLEPKSAKSECLNEWLKRFDMENVGNRYVRFAEKILSS